ncbi:hypothetical protein JL722_956 [Aureococcus anophagefferens]|nr:hypothetical protein JL722_956 [Aureococcus anophagefferens]
MARRRLVAATCVLLLRSSASLRVALCVTGQLRTFDREAVRESQANRLVGDLRRQASSLDSFLVVSEALSTTTTGWLQTLYAPVSIDVVDVRNHNFQYSMHATCGERMRERERATGEAYAWAIKSRFDLFFYGPSPALASLSAAAVHSRMRRWPYGNETFDVDALSGEIQSWEHGAKESPGCSPDGGEIRVDDQVAFVPAAFIGAYFDDHVGTGVVHREVLSGGEGSVLGRYPVGGWAEVPRPLSSKASGPVVAWCVGGGGSHVACGFGDGTVEADRRDSGGADGARPTTTTTTRATTRAPSPTWPWRASPGARARTLAVCYAAKSDDAVRRRRAWDVEDGCAGARAPRVAKRFDDFDDAADLACAESLDAFAFVLATPDGTGAVFVADGCSGAAPAFERLDDDGEDDDASWALAFAGEALLAVSPAFRCTVFRRDRGAWTAAAQLDWSAAPARRGVLAEPRLAAAGASSPSRAPSPSTSSAPRTSATRRRRPRAAPPAPRASLVRGDAVGAAALVWDRVHVGAAADGGGAALCLDSSGALREAGATFATVWAGAHFPVGYELLLDNVHYAECEDELDFCGGVEQLPTYETDLRTVDGFFAVSMDDEELSDEVLDVVGSSRGAAAAALREPADRGRARGHDDELAGASVGAVGDPTVAKFRALLLWRSTASSRRSAEGAPGWRVAVVVENPELRAVAAARVDDELEREREARAPSAAAAPRAGEVRVEEDDAARRGRDSSTRGPAGSRNRVGAAHVAPLAADVDEL